MKTQLGKLTMAICHSIYHNLSNLKHLVQEGKYPSVVAGT